MSKNSAGPIGKPLDRVDGRLKVTGQARYAAEVQLPDLCHAVLVTSTVGRGRVTGLDTAAAEKAPGVLAVLTHRHTSQLSLPEEARAMTDPPVGRPFAPIQGDEVYYNGQPLAVVVADTLERAVQAAGLVRAGYREERPVADFAAAAARAFPPTQP